MFYRRACLITFFLSILNRCIISGTELIHLVDITDQRDEDSTFYCADFYPGQQVQGIPRVFKEAKYISGVKPILGNQRTVKAIVESVLMFTFILLYIIYTYIFFIFYLYCWRQYFSWKFSILCSLQNLTNTWLIFLLYHFIKRWL